MNTALHVHFTQHIHAASQCNLLTSEDIAHKELVHDFNIST